MKEIYLTISAHSCENDASAPPQDLIFDIINSGVKKLETYLSFYSIRVDSTKILTNLEPTRKESATKAEAEWITWSGWKGNHDQRIEDSQCSNCGYIHPTVYGSLNNLSRTCPSCGSSMLANDNY